MRQGRVPARRSPLKSDRARPNRLVRVTIVLPKWLYDEIEGQRGLIKRSTFIVNLLQQKFELAETRPTKTISSRRS